MWCFRRSEFTQNIPSGQSTKMLNTGGPLGTVHMTPRDRSMGGPAPGPPGSRPSPGLGCSHLRAWSAWRWAQGAAGSQLREQRSACRERVWAQGAVHSTPHSSPPSGMWSCSACCVVAVPSLVPRGRAEGPERGFSGMKVLAGRVPRGSARPRDLRRVRCC